MSLIHRLSPRAVVSLLVLGAGAVLATAVALAPLASAQSAWQLRPAEGARRTGLFRNPALSESSGVAASRRQPGVLWSLNDSGNPAWIFATDTLGRDLGVFAVAGARNQDWEAISLGPCGAEDCIYIADVGDNEGRRPTVQLYRIPEPTVPAPARKRATARAEVLQVRYPDRPRDVEAALVDRDGGVILVSKGRSGTARTYRVPPDAWGDSVATAEALGALPLATAQGLGSLVTDMGLAPYGDRVAIRTYLEIYLFRLTPDHRLQPLGVACDVTGLELQGEGLTWLDGETLALTSEGGFGAPGTVSVARCPID